MMIVHNVTGVNEVLQVRIDSESRARDIPLPLAFTTLDNVATTHTTPTSPPPRALRPHDKNEWKQFSQLSAYRFKMFESLSLSRLVHNCFFEMKFKVEHVSKRLANT